MGGEKMKIAMIGHKRIPSREGGVEVVVEELATRFVEAGHQVDVYNRMGRHVAGKKLSKKGKRLKQYKGIKIITIPTINVKGLDATIYSFFASIKALFGGYDVIHYHAEGPSIMVWLPHIFRIKTIVTIHGLDWKRGKWGGAAKRVLKLGEKNAVKYADEMIVLSKNVQRYFKKNYGRETTYIPNGVSIPTKRWAEIIKKNYGVNKNEYFLFLARIVPEKGLHYLLEAFREVSTDKKLIVAGGVSHSNMYMDQVKKMAVDDERVIFTGFVQGEVLEELYSNCFAYVLPSDIEGMPLSLLEAMSHDCRCIVSDIAENIEVTGDDGLYFQKSNVESLRRVLEETLKSTDSFGKYDMSRFDWDIIAENNLKTYC